MSTTTEAERYCFVQEKSGLSKKDFAESLGIFKSTGSMVSAGRQNLSRKTLEKMKQLYHVNLDWYLTGEGPSGLDQDNVEIELLDQEAAAGHGREVADYAESRLFQVPRALISPYRPDKLQAVYVAGDSMTGDNIFSGDIVIFFPGLREGDGVYVVSLDNALLVKHVSYDETHQTLDLVSSNPAYPPRHFAGAELENIRIAGKVIAVFHRV
jgi:phage repressor protein C with HTH and peptisase S24 domain